jgi:phosphoesterase RecJ-like protein
LEHTDFDSIAKKLATPSRILITTHTNPDGDAIGSSLALCAYLGKKGHRVKVMVPDAYPDFLAWLPGHEKILIFKDQQQDCIQAIEESEIIFSVDYNSFSRLNEAGNLVMSSKAVKILIDHHLNPAPHYDFMISVSATSSTCELIYDFIRESGDQHLMDKEIAMCIYTGIATDTGSFSYSCNDAKTYMVVADLFRLGIDGEHIHRLIYDTYSESRLRLLGYSISDKLVVLPELHTAYITLSKDELDRFNHQIGDTEGIVNYALSIKDINLAALFMERDGIVKVSFRSKGNFPVNVLAADYFNGGGHSNASGANCDTSLEDTVSLFLSLLPQFSHKLREVY